MTVDVALSPVDNTRVMMGPNLPIEEVTALFEREKTNIESSRRAYEQWLADAKSKSGSTSNDAAILAAARHNLEGARQIKNPVDNTDGQIQSR